MFNNKRIVAIVPARGRSRGLPKKNLAKLRGKPLLYHTIKSALESKLLDSIYVSTDSKSIAHVAKDLKIPVIKRPEKYSTDSSKTVDVLHHAIGHLSHLGRGYDAVALLQPTSPFRLGYDIDGCIQLLFEDNLDSSLSIAAVRQHPEWMLKLDKKGHVSFLYPTRRSVSSRQILSDLFYPNGAVYVSKVKFLLKQHDLIFGGKCGGYVMDELRSMDIDTALDLKVAERLYPDFVKKYRHNI